MVAVLREQFPQQTVNVPHFKLPLRFVSTSAGIRADVTEQDTYDEIRDCIEATARYELEQRPEAPTFGIPQQVFGNPVDSSEVLVHLQNNEPRMSAVIGHQISDDDDLLAIITTRIEDNEDGAANVRLH